MELLNIGNMRRVVVLKYKILHLYFSQAVQVSLVAKTWPHWPWIVKLKQITVVLYFYATLSWLIAMPFDETEPNIVTLANWSKASNSPDIAIELSNFFFRVTYVRWPKSFLNQKFWQTICSVLKQIVWTQNICVANPKIDWNAIVIVH